MDVIGWMQPRDPRAAGRAVAILVGVAATTSVLTAPIQTRHVGRTELAGAGLLLLLVVAFAFVAHGTSRRRTSTWTWTLAPLVSVPAMTVIDLLTDDATVTAQIFFVFPILYGASQLRPAGAATLSAFVLAGEVVVVTTMLPPEEALINAWYVLAALGTTAALLTVMSEQNARLVARLEEVASVDPLTGLATRRVLDDRADAVAAGGGALLLLDVDHFKTINDRFGHPVGDGVLAALATILLGRSREDDLVCRLGGDEIAVLLPGCSYTAALARAEEILADTRAHAFDLGAGAVLPVSVSIGVAHLPTHASGLQGLYSAADAALYEAKQRGRGQVAGADGVVGPTPVPPLADSA
ncbi:MAG TPA: GGDEF domain-containing protein [Nocardioides sp.]|nr:GGDEF domain-containing protein [Nocardioides sp.]